MNRRLSTNRMFQMQKKKKINTIPFGKRHDNSLLDVNSKLGAGIFILHI